MFYLSDYLAFCGLARHADALSIDLHIAIAEPFPSLKGDIEPLVDSLVERASSNSWIEPLKPSKHPFFCNRGRRSLLRGVGDARRHLSKMSVKQSRQELLGYIHQHNLPLGAMGTRRPDAKWTMMKKDGGWWNLGTLQPNVIDCQGTHQIVSAWVAALVWEVVSLLPETIDKMSRPIGDNRASSQILIPGHPHSEPIPAASMLAELAFSDVGEYVFAPLQFKFVLANYISDQSAEYYPRALGVDPDSSCYSGNRLVLRQHERAANGIALAEAYRQEIEAWRKQQNLNQSQ